MIEFLTKSTANWAVGTGSFPSQTNQALEGSERRNVDGGRQRRWNGAMPKWVTTYFEMTPMADKYEIDKAVKESSRLVSVMS